ncbi:Crp/Fnr family transcriptional regulator [Amycolatopsis sp. cmx-11-12]|uniref:Crp/Fnr family transcriptional regulator n=1 Tax=Amycolatopsis sp. cmx-11-12 TaxID=2785795 RepID=UPI003916EC80
MSQNTSLHLTDFLSARQRAELEGLADEVAYPPEHTIFWEGEPSLSVLIIQSGNVKVTRQGADGAEIIFAIRGADEVMGEEGVLMAESRSATVSTITAVSGLILRADELLRFVSQQDLWPAMYRAAVRRRRQLEERLMLARLDVRSRLARWLLELATEVGEDTEAGWVIESTLSQQDLAARIGASRDGVAIELRKLRERGLVTTGRRRIVLHDLAALRAIVAG